MYAPDDPGEYVGRDISSLPAWLSEETRVVRPGESLPTDYRINRLTVVVDRDHIITRAFWG